MTKAFRFIETVKKFPDFKLGPLNFDLDPGTVLGYIGPNGSGKTTTMHCLVGLLKADSGKMEIFGKENDPNNPAWKFDIGYVGDKHVFYENWSGERNLKFLSQFYPDWSHKYAEELIKRFEVPVHKRAKDMSGGNRVKLSLISALAHSPKLLILDEPTAGLDPVVRSEVLDTFFEAVESGERAIFYSTHILSDISRLADELAFLKEGQVIMRKTKDDLTDMWRRITFKLNTDNTDFKNVKSIQREGNNFKVVSDNYNSTLAHLREIGAESLQDNRMTIDEIAVQILKGNNNVANT